MIRMWHFEQKVLKPLLLIQIKPQHPLVVSTLAEVYLCDIYISSSFYEFGIDFITTVFLFFSHRLQEDLKKHKT